MALFNFPNKEEVVLPWSLKTDVAGFSFFARLLDKTAVKKHYIFDFSQVSWFDANLCAVLAAIIYINRAKGSEFSYQGIDNPQLKNTLLNIGLLPLLDKQDLAERKNSAIPLQEFDMTDEAKVERYIYHYILKSEKVPKMSAGAKRKVFRSIFEIYQNSVMHSGASHNYVCGQYFHHKGTMALTMVEVGKTFKDNVRSHDSSFVTYSGKESIEWAVEKGNTTKPAEETGGLGLDLIREFLRLNKGKLQILSADGYWEEKKSEIYTDDCDSSFMGSIVNIEFNLRDENAYSTPEELDISNIL